MRRSFNACDFYIFILVLWMSGSFFHIPAIVIQGLLSVFLLLSIYYAIYANLNYKLPIYYKALDVLLVMFTIYGLIMIIIGEQHYIASIPISKTYYLVAIYISLLPIYASYVFARKGLLTENKMQFYFVVFLLLTVLSFYGNQAKMLRIAIEMGSTAEEFTNNVGYTFLGLLPALVLFYKKPILQYLFMIFCTYFILLAMKRGAILAAGICLLWFMTTNLKKSTRRQKKIIVLISILVIMFGIYIFRDLMANSLYFQQRIAETKAGNSSNRNIIYTNIFEQFISEDNPIHFFWGNGADATLKFRQNYAHNDWLEIAINQGLFGIVVYLVYWVYFFVTWRRTKHHPQAFMATGMILIIYFLLTFFSMSYNSVSRFAALVLGYYLAIAPIKQRPINSDDSFVE